MNAKIAEQIVAYRMNHDVSVESNQNIGYLIKKERLRQELRLTDVARGICSLSYLSKIENNAIDPNDRIFEEICERLNLDPIEPTNNEQTNSKLEVLASLLNAIERKSALKVEEAMDVFKRSYNKDEDHIDQLIMLTYALHKRDMYKVKSLCHELFKVHNHFSNYELCIFYEQVGSYYLVKKHYDDARRFIMLSYQMMKKLGLKRPLLTYKLAWVYYALRLKYKSYLIALEASQQFNLQNNFFRKIQTEILIALCLATEDFTLSLEKYTNLIQTTEQLQFHQLNYICRYNLGLLYFDYEHYATALEIFNTLNKEACEEDLDVLFKMIHIYVKLDNHQLAEHYINKLDDLEMNSEKKQIYKQYYQIMLDDDSGNKVLKFYKNDALPYARREKKINFEIKLLQQRAAIYEKEGRYKDALEDFKKITKRIGLLL